MTNNTTEKLSWFDRIKKDIEKEVTEGNMLFEFFGGEFPEHHIYFYEADDIPSIKIYNVDFSGSITYKVDEGRGEFYKECYREDHHTCEPFKLRMIYGSYTMFIGDLISELKGDDYYPEEYIRGWK